MNKGPGWDGCPPWQLLNRCAKLSTKGPFLRRSLTDEALDGLHLPALDASGYDDGPMPRQGQPNLGSLCKLLQRHPALRYLGLNVNALDAAPHPSRRHTHFSAWDVVKECSPIRCGIDVAAFLAAPHRQAAQVRLHFGDWFTQRVGRGFEGRSSCSSLPGSTTAPDCGRWMVRSADLFRVVVGEEPRTSVELSFDRWPHSGVSNRFAYEGNWGFFAGQSAQRHRKGRAQQARSRAMLIQSGRTSA